jgi:hypothetical protein
VKELALAADAKKLVLPIWIVRANVSKAFKYYLVDVQQLDLAVDFEAGVEQLLTALEPIREGRLHAVLADPAMTTQEKIAAYFKVRAAQRDPVERRMAQLDERIRTATGVERQKLQAERWDLFQKKTEDAIAKANAATARWNRIVDNVIDAAKRDQEE